MSIYKMNSEQTLKFVHLYKNCKCLWDVSSNDYKNRRTRYRALTHIANEMNILGFGPNEVGQKIKNLRTTYKQELHKIAKSKQNGGTVSGVAFVGDEENATCTIYKPKIPWFDTMDSIVRSFHVNKSPFLYRVLEAGDTSLMGQSPNFDDSLDGEIILQECIEIDDDDESSTNNGNDISVVNFSEGNFLSDPLSVDNHVAKKRRLTGQFIEKSTTNSNNNSNGSNNNNNKNGSADIDKMAAVHSLHETEFDLWTRSLALQLNNMETSRALKLQLQIQTLISNERLNYEEKKLTNGTCINYTVIKQEAGGEI